MNESFEETLSQLQREPLPLAWKDDLIAEAISEAAQNPPVIRTGIFTKVAIGAIAACWVGALLFHLATPPSANSAELAQRFNTTPEYLPLLAQRLAPTTFELEFNRK